LPEAKPPVATAPATAGRRADLAVPPLPTPTLFFAPLEQAPDERVPTPRAAEGADDPAAKPSAEKPAGETARGAEEPKEKKPAFPPIGDMTFKQVVIKDLREGPGALGRGFKQSVAKPENLLILGIAFGADRTTREHWDTTVRDYFRRHAYHTSLSQTGDFGSIIGNPSLHAGIGLIWYGLAVNAHDDKQHEFSRVLLEALIVNDLTTVVLKESMRDKGPNGERWGWPSGHASSSFCIASVIHEYYGWGPAIPCYLVAGYSAATRLADREHDLSDLVFGTALGLVIGHSVVKGELPQIAGFRVLPMGGPGVGGVMLVKSW
jgi:hypothetical protein